MPDEENRQILALRGGKERPRAFPNLGDASRRGLDARQIHRLNRINDDNFRTERLNMLFDLVQVIFAKHIERIRRDTEPRCAEFRLAHRFFAGNVKHIAVISTERVAGLEQQR